MDALSNKLSLLRTNIANTYGSLTTATNGPTYPYIVQVNLYNPVPGSYDITNTLDQFRNRAAIITIPIAVITLQAFALILFFASLLANLLVDQQAETIAILRSRGASISQIFGSLLVQSIILGVIALVIGPVLALIIVSLISQHVLGAAEQAAISQVISDMATFESGADFSGDLTAITQSLTVQKETSLYRSITGVKSATVGFTGSGVSSGTTLSIPIEVRAVDAHTFAQTGIWTSQDSSQSLTFLMEQLMDTSSDATGNNQIPVIIDAGTAHRLDLQIGNTFAVNVNNLSNSNLNCLVIAVVQHIPTVNSSDTSSSSGTYVAPGGILLDYTTYALVYKRDLLVRGSTSDSYLPINHVWLRTQSDGESLVSVREALNSPGLRLQNLYDRRLLVDTMSSDPLYLSLIIVLTIGSVTALLLALVGSLLASWLSVRNRLSSFTVMRALGRVPAQITKVLLWEQIIVYTTALLLGIVYGAVLSVTAVPTLAFTSLSAGGVLSSLSSDEFYVFQRIIPAQVVIPLSLGLAFAALVAIFVVALWIMASVTLRPSISQTLRLNED